MPERAVRYAIVPAESGLRQPRHTAPCGVMVKREKSPADVLERDVFRRAKWPSR